MRFDFDCKMDFDVLKDVEDRVFSLGEHKKSALFIVDMNNGFAVDGPLSSSLVYDIIPAVVKTAGIFKDAGAPIIAFTDRHSQNAAEFAYLPAHCIEGTAESELVDGLKPFEEYMTVIGKNSTNGFMEEETRSIVKRLIDDGCENFVITGCCTDICVKTFAITLKTYFNSLDLNAAIVVPAEAVETYDAPGHPADAMNMFGMYDMWQNGISLVSEITE